MTYHDAALTVRTRADAKSTAMREQIMHEALEIAAFEGVRAASIRRIATAVNMRAATIYTFFPEGKDQLIGAALVHLYDSFSEDVIAAIRDDEASHENLRMLVFRHIRWHMSRPRTAPAWDMIVRADEMSPFLPEEVRQQVQVNITRYQEIVRDLVIDLGHDPLDAACWAEMIIVLCDGSSVWTSRGMRGNVMSSAEEMAWLAVRGILGLRER